MNFLAKKNYDRKGVTTMTYTKPEITTLGEATELICSDDSVLKVHGGSDSQDPNRMTIEAYSADE